MSRLWMRWMGLLGCLGFVITAHAQVSPSFFDYARPGLDWYEIETEHFHVLFHADAQGRGSSRTAQVVARIAEEIYEPITALYGHRPDGKVTFVLKDYEDYSNGAAYFFDNKIEIWAPALDSPLRGDHNWLRNVITHEFTHIVQVQKTIRTSRRVPLFYLQVLDYEDVKRPDVLYGYPNLIASLPLAMLNNPAWLAEGTAQYQRAGLDYDTWDTHRDMLLRTRVLAGKALTLDEMGGFFSHTSLLREGVYNHGFAFTRYLARTYGEDVLRRLSRALARWDNWNVEGALKDATGRPGRAVYDDWMEGLRAGYAAGTEAVRASLVEGALIEAEGFSNFYPRFSPEGTRLAYVSNRGQDFNRMSLYVRDVASGEVTAYALDGLGGEGPSYTCSLGHLVKQGVGGAVTWRPDGRALVYARAADTPTGALYADLYELDLDTRRARRLTREARAAEPAFSPDGRHLVFVQQQDGTTNLVQWDAGTEALTPLTRYGGGVQVSGPVWHPSGEWVYFARLGPDGRDLYRIRPDGTGEEAVLATPADERTPAFDPAGQYLYYASDASGIFNLYRVPTAGGPAERLTNVLGGAFMPAVRADGRLAFAQYQWDGYKLAGFDAPPRLDEAARTATYTPPASTQKEDVAPLAAAAGGALNAFDDTDLAPLPGEAITAVRTERRFPLAPAGNAGDGAPPPRTVKPYGGLFTAFTFFPVVRLDQYVERRADPRDARLGARTRGEALARNTKVGVYVSSREVLEGLSMLGSLLVAPASREATSLGDFFAPARLLELDRDAFLQFDYNRGLPFIPRRWSPQLSLELYNIRRNVASGLSFEEYPCTACFPDTTFADLSYSLWEANLFARSKVNRNLLVEAGARYSPYRVTTEAFFSSEAKQTIPGSSSRYYIGRTGHLRAYYEALWPHTDEDVVPVGLSAQATVEREWGQLLDRFALENGLLVPRYRSYRNTRLSAEGRIGLRLPGRPLGGTHGLSLRMRASTLLGGPVDDFFNDYAGGLVGARGYPFYALGGNEAAWVQASYLFPLVPRIRKQVGFAYVDKLYGRLYADAAMAWSGAWPGLGAVRKDVGGELRLALGSFYLFPTAIFVSGTYGLDRFDVQLSEGFVTPDGRTAVTYGRAWQWHFGMLFDFSL